MDHGVSAGDGHVEAWSTTRLPFEPTGSQVGFRRELAAACRGLTARPGQVLHACYAAADTRVVDLENVLTYNLGPGAVRAAARYGLVLERAPAPDDGRHHYRYRVVDAGTRWSYWAAGEPLGSVRLLVPSAGVRGLFTGPTAGRWWLAARRAGVTAAVRSAAVPGRLALRVTVAPPEGWRGSLAGLLKPLTDGLVAAVHAHEGPFDGLVERASAVDPDLTPGEFEALLQEPREAPLGRVRLVVRWGATLQWLPADDRIVALDVRLAPGHAPGTVTAEFCVPTAASGR
ncbi:hypothetical protein BJF78_12050 [Pseudonocardia sp. CNS-139]|nr:hypothetical protein BJF78_12050 [Pseudonocardia sp. CNS-139]